MWLTERETVTKVFYVNGIREIRDKDCYLLCIEEQEEIIHTEDGIKLFYNYYMFDPAYSAKMFMYGTTNKCMPNEATIINYFEDYDTEYRK